MLTIKISDRIKRIFFINFSAGQKLLRLITEGINFWKDD